MAKDVSGFAVAGMAGVVGGATGAAMAAIVMIFEMTLDYNVIIPVTITVALSYGIRKFLCPESIYTLKLTRRGHHIPSALHANLSHVKHVKDIMQSTITVLPASSTLDALATTVLEHPKQSHFVVHDGDRIVGLVGREAALGALDQSHVAKTLGQVANTQFVVVPPDAMLADLLGKMYTQGASIAIVAASTQAPSITDIQGIVTEHETADAMIRSVDLFCD
jgi:CIC family chloride channel protein